MTKPVRLVDSKEIKKRGCYLCLDNRRITRGTQADRRVKGERYTGCIYHKCPYHELDKYETYKEYEEKEMAAYANLLDALEGSL